MQQDTLERPVVSQPDEPVPSRYAMKIGDIEVLVISDGVLPLSSETMSTNVAPAERDAWFDVQFLAETFDWPLNVLVVRSGDQTILVDAGLGGQFDGFPRAGQTIKRLEAAGIDLGAVTDIVITHMHMDHVGGLVDPGIRSRLRADVRIHVNAAEVAFWKAPDFSHTDMPDPVPEILRTTSKAFLEQYHDRIQTFDQEREVAPGVVAQRTGGHTPGHSIVYVTSGGKKLTFAGDMLFPPAFDHPEWHNGFEHDPEESVRIRRRILNEAVESRELIVATHMPFPSVGQVAPNGDRYRWVPAIWDF